MKERTRIAVLVSGGGTNLQALIDAEKNGLIQNGTIVLVLSDHADAFALTRAKNAGIPTATVLKKECGGQAPFEDAILDALKAQQVDFIILGGFLNILTDRFIAAYPKRVINIHPSLIPSFCGKGYYGLRVHEAALERGVKLTGATVHYVNEIPDGGEIILQKAVPVMENDTPSTLQRRVMEEAEWVLLPQAAELVSAQIRAGK